MRRLVSALLVASLLALVLGASAFAGNGGFGPEAPVSPNASRINDAYWLIFGFTAFVFVVVESALVWFVIRYRRRGRPRDAEGMQIHGSTRLEVAWTVVPVLILAAIGAFVFYKLPGIKDVPSARAGEQLTVQVQAHQFYWEFRYPNGQLSVDTMVVPAGRVVRLEVTTPDVAHSWWIPRLGGKIDAIPGRVNTTWFQTDRLGTYPGQCAEFCGLYHAAMRANVVVVAPEQFSGFLSSHGAGSAAVGKETFTGACAKCHGSLGQGAYGPKIAGNATLADRQALEQLLREGKGRMPAVGKDWPDAQIDALFRDLKGRFSSGG
ncbi:MAG TPA: cytochrome c oxidase subunit II [Gaiellaceae bacterium]|nr:cytochrome c oxidase subunit II [Gaiellaceae bacterium]